MALKLKYTDEHGILHINMSPTASPRVAPDADNSEKTESIVDPKFDTINNRFGQYDLFGGKYEGGEHSLFRSRYNSIEEELANTPYAFTTERSLRLNSASSPLLDITINSRTLSDETSPSKDIEDDRFFHKNYDTLFGPQIDLQTSIKTSDEEETPAFTVTQLIHAQDRYFDLSSRHSSSVVDSPKSEVRTVRTQVRNSAQDTTEPVRTVGTSARNRAEPVRTVRTSASAKTGVRGEDSVRKKDGAFKVLASEVKTVPAAYESAVKFPSTPTAKRKREKSFAIITETPVASRPSSPRSLPVEITIERRSPFRGRGFREETSRHSTPRASAANSRANSPPRRRTRSLSRIDKMATATLPPPIPHSLSRPHSPKNFVKQNIEEVRELSELNREKHEAEAEKRRREEEEALLKEMGLFEKNAKSDAIRSIVCSRTNSRSNSPTKARLRSRSTSPVTAQAPSAIIHFENIEAEIKEYVNIDDGMPIPPVRPSRVRVAKSQPQSNDGSPKHSKIPKRQNSVSPSRNDRRNTLSNRRIENNLNKNQRFISNSTSSINETIRIGSQVHDKRSMSKSTQFLNISPKHIKGKPPISPGRLGPPPSNKYINPKRLSPIVGTPNKSPVEGSKPASARTPTKPSPVTRKPVKTAGNTPATSRLNSRQPSRAVSRDPSPDKRRTVTKSSLSKSTTNLAKNRPASRAVSTKTPQKPIISNKSEPRKPINRTNSMKSLTKTPSVKNLIEKPSTLKKKDSSKDLSQSTNKLNDAGAKNKTDNNPKSPIKIDTRKDTLDKKSAKKDKSEQQSNKETIDEQKKEETKKTMESSNSTDEVMTQDNETQYDKITNDKGELVILTKKNIVSMTTAAITAQPLEVVTTVTNQLPAALEKAREKGIFERHGSKDSLAPKDDNKESKADAKESSKNEVKDKIEEEKKPIKLERTIFTEDNVKLKPLLPPYNNPQVERVKQKIDDILKSPEVSSENIIVTTPVIKPKENNTKTMTSFKNIADKTKNDIKQTKDGVATKLTNLKDEIVKQNEKAAADIRSEATKIVNSIITPVEEPKDIIEKVKVEAKKDIEPIVMVVNEKKKNPMKNEIVEKMTETLVKGEPEVEVQSSNVSTPGKMGALNRVLASKMAESDSDKSQSNGGFPQSTSTTPKPPVRTNRSQKDGSDGKSSNDTTKESSPDTGGKKQNLCQRLMGKCKSKCCPCCLKPEDDETEKALTPPPQEKKGGAISKLNCFKKKGDLESVEKAVSHEDLERAAGKAASIEFESETKRKRKLRDVLCGCCSSRRVSAVGEPQPRDVTPEVVGATGCCGGRRAGERRDSILSDRPPTSLCNNRVFTWVRGACRRQPERPSQPASRRQSLFSKNKSLSPTLPPEDTRVKLDASLVEHTSVMRGAIPVLPLALAYFCLVCNVIVPGLGTIFSGMFCLCFGIPRFGVHDGAKHRIGSFFINLVVGCGQLFTVLFCLVGWGWSIWWGVVMLKISRKYRKLKAEAKAEEEEAAPPVTTNNHTQA